VTRVLDALRGYVQLATGLTEVTVARAREAAAAVIAQGIELAAVRDVPGGDQASDAAKVAATQVQGLTEDLLETSKQNREMLVGLIRTEVDRAAGRMGFVREEELAAVRLHVARLESQLVDIRTAMSTGAQVAPPAAAKPAPTSEPAAAERAAAQPSEAASAPKAAKKKIPVTKPADES
jgi:hypothetical protein